MYFSNTGINVISSTAGGEARAFLLPLLSQPHPSPLGHFIRYFVPLTEQMFDLQQKAEVEDRPAEAKVWSVLVTQVWNGLPAYCYRTPDLEEVRSKFLMKFFEAHYF